MKVIRSSHLVRGKINIDGYTCNCPYCLSELEFEKSDILIPDTEVRTKKLLKNQVYLIDGGDYDGYYLLANYIGDRFYINCEVCGKPITFLSFGDKLEGEQIIVNPEKYTLVFDEINLRYYVVRLDEFEEYASIKHDDITDDYYSLLNSPKCVYIKFLGNDTTLYDENMDTFVSKVYKDLDSIKNDIAFEDFCCYYNENDYYFDKNMNMFIDSNCFGELKVDKDNNIRI